jgi:hypothetical protein
MMNVNLTILCIHAHVFAEGIDIGGGLGKVDVIQQLPLHVSRGKQSDGSTRQHIKLQAVLREVVALVRACAGRGCEIITTAAEVEQQQLLPVYLEKACRVEALGTMQQKLATECLQLLQEQLAQPRPDVAQASMVLGTLQDRLFSNSAEPLQVLLSCCEHHGRQRMVACKLTLLLCCRLQYHNTWHGFTSCLWHQLLPS